MCISWRKGKITYFIRNKIINFDGLYLCEFIIGRDDESPDLLIGKWNIFILRRIGGFCENSKIQQAFVMLSSLATARKYLKVLISIRSASPIAFCYFK